MVIVVYVAAGAFIAAGYAEVGIGAVCCMWIKPTHIAAFHAFKMMFYGVVAHIFQVMPEIVFVNLDFSTAVDTVGGVIAVDLMAIRGTDIAAGRTPIMMAFCTIGGVNEVADMGDAIFANDAFVVAGCAVGGVIAAGTMLVDNLLAANIADVTVTFFAEGNALTPGVQNAFNGALVAALEAVGGVVTGSAMLVGSTDCVTALADIVMAFGTFTYSVVFAVSIPDVINFLPVADSTTVFAAVWFGAGNHMFDV